jgi:hypothetical protein
MAQNLILKIISHCLFNGRMKPLAILNVHLIGLPGARRLSELLVVAGQDELEEFIILKGATSIEVIELHEHLAIFNLELGSLVIHHEVVDVQHVDLTVAINIQPRKGREGFKIVKGCQFLTGLLHVKLLCRCSPEEVNEGVLTL